MHIDYDADSIEYMRRQLAERTDIAYLGGFTRPEEAIAYLQQPDNPDPDLVFASTAVLGHDDFRLAMLIIQSGTGIVLLTTRPVPGIAAVNMAPISYLHLPVDERELDEVLQSYYQRAAKQLPGINIAGLEQLLQPLFEQQNYPRRIFVNLLGKLVVVHLKDVLCLITTENYTNIVRNDGSKLLSSKPLRTYAALLKHHPDFVRVHRSALVNRNFIRHILRDGERHRYTIVLTDDEEIPISYSKREEILQQLIR